MISGSSNSQSIETISGVTISRRVFLLASPIVLAGCVTDQNPPFGGLEGRLDRQVTADYRAVRNEPFPLPAIDLTTINPKYLRREVEYRTSEQLGTIVIDPGERYAYLVLAGGRAVRYGVGVGRVEAFDFQGTATVGRKAEWPRWTPTMAMIRRDPRRYSKYAGGLDGGPTNPLGPRALYLYRDGQDTMYRLHGTIEPWTIGTMVSSGCIRLLNQDIIDLYRHAPIGTKVTVLPTTST